jgi:hypothetical protein
VSSHDGRTSAGDAWIEPGGGSDGAVSFDRVIPAVALPDTGGVARPCAPIVNSFS